MPYAEASILLKSMMHIAISPYLHKIHKFVPCFIKISSLFLFNLRFLLNLRFLASPYFDHDAFMLYMYWTPLAICIVIMAKAMSWMVQLKGKC